eukprot:784964-Amphidinium_carterae.1
MRSCLQLRSSSQLSSFLQQVTSVGPSNASADVLVAALSELCKLALSAGKLGRTASAMQKVLLLAVLRTKT